MNITVSPAPQGRFHAFLNDRLLCTSRTPFLAAARILELEQVRGATTITMTHRGSDVICLTSTVAQAAALTVIESDHRPMKLATFKAIPGSDL